MRVRLLFSNLAAERAASLRKGARNEHEPQNGTSACALLCPAPAARGVPPHGLKKAKKYTFFSKSSFSDTKTSISEHLS